MPSRNAAATATAEIEAPAEIETEDAEITLAVPWDGATAAGTSKFSQYERERGMNATIYVREEQMEAWRNANGDKSVTGVVVTVTPVYGD